MVGQQHLASHVGQIYRLDTFQISDQIHTTAQVDMVPHTTVPVQVTE